MLEKLGKLSREQSANKNTYSNMRGYLKYRKESPYDKSRHLNNRNKSLVQIPPAEYQNSSRCHVEVTLEDRNGSRYYSIIDSGISE